MSRMFFVIAISMYALGISVSLVGCGRSETPTGAVVTDYPADDSHAVQEKPGRQRK